MEVLSDNATPLPTSSIWMTTTFDLPDTLTSELDSLLRSEMVKPIVVAESYKAQMILTAPGSESFDIYRELLEYDYDFDGGNFSGDDSLPPADVSIPYALPQQLPQTKGKKSRSGRRNKSVESALSFEEMLQRVIDTGKKYCNLPEGPYAAEMPINPPRGAASLVTKLQKQELAEACVKYVGGDGMPDFQMIKIAIRFYGEFPSWRARTPRSVQKDAPSKILLHNAKRLKIRVRAKTASKNTAPSQALYLAGTLGGSGAELKAETLEFGVCVVRSLL